jgi:hypothetical protein
MKKITFVLLISSSILTACKVKRCPSVEDQEKRSHNRYSKDGLIRK